jgi:hypothetical protein
VAIAAWGAEDLHGGLGGASFPRTMDTFLRPTLFLGRNNEERGEEGEKENVPLFIFWLDSPLPFLFLCSKSDHPKAEDFTFTPFSSFLSLAKRDSIFF